MMMNQAPGPARRAARLEPGTMIYKSNAMSQYGINITMIKFNLQVTVTPSLLRVQVDSEFWHWQLASVPVTVTRTVRGCPPPPATEPE